MRRFIDGSFSLLTADGVKLGTLVVAETGAWGLGRFFFRRGGEPGDYLTLILDTSSRNAATVSLVDVEAVNELASGGL